MENGTDVLRAFGEARELLYDHVGFVPGWVECPIDLVTSDKWWGLSDNTVKYADTKAEYASQSGNYYEDDLYMQRFYKKLVYEGEKYTMVFCNPHVDGVQWFRFFKNDLRME